MATFFIALFSVVLVLVCLFVTLLVLMQKPSSNSGMGAALGGGAAEQAFGGEAGNVLTRGTIYAIIAFFVLSFALYLGTLSTVQSGGDGEGGVSITKLEGDQPMSVNGTGGEESTDTPAGEGGSTTDQSKSTGSDGDASQVQGEPSADGSSPLQLEELDAPKPNGDS